jgi:hypothetical protein
MNQIFIKYLKMKKIILIISVFTYFATHAQQKEMGLRAMGTPHNPKVKATWNHYNDYAMITDLCKQLANTHPNLVKLGSIGKSVQGKEIWVMTITDSKTGNADDKPAFYIDGNIHSNELQGTEVALYTAWYLAENFENVKFIKELLQEKTLYIVPTINPDGRENFLKEPNTMHSPRSGMLAIDDDQDGLLDEDNFDDLDNNGEITLMRRKSANGRFKPNPKYPNMMVQVATEERGEYELLGYEGLDNDGDGQINEDRAGYYDPNRDWGWFWQPDYVQFGAYKYPFSLPETRAVMDFVYQHPNIAGAQTYHNFGGMFLRGPGIEEDIPYYSQRDIEVYDVFGKLGEKIIPGYKYLVSYKDLYSVYGGESDWFHGARGIFTFTNELMTSYLFFHKQEKDDMFDSGAEFYEFDKFLLFGDAFVEWKPFKHPQYGDIEIGGFKKNYTRNHPGFMLEQDAHRNMAFTLFHTYHTPKLEVQEVKAKNLGNGFTQITATIANTRVIPTHSEHDVKNKIDRPDQIILKNTSVIAGILMENADLDLGKEQKFKPESIEVPTIKGNGFVVVRWVIKGNLNDYKIEISSTKGGKSTHTGKVKP